MFVIILKEIGNIHSYYRQQFHGPEFDCIHKNGVRSGFSTFIFSNKKEAESYREKLNEQYENCSSMEFEIVPLNELKTFVDNHFGQ